jgi:hypothetical protein
MESVSHGLWKDKRWGGVPSFIKEHESVNISLKNLLIFIWKIVRTPLPVVDKANHLSKPNFYLSILQMKSSSTCLITASLCEGSFFYFYVESPPSTFMHRLREHSGHSEFNVHCPKVIIDWFMIMVSLILKLFISSRPLKLEGVLCIYVLLFHEGQAENYLLCFPYDLNTRLTFIVLLFMIFRLCLFSCYNVVAKFLLSRLYLLCPCFKFFDPSTQFLLRWSRLWRCMSPQKLFFCYHLPTRGWAGVKLGDAWYVSNVSIIFDAACLFIHHLLCVLLHFVAFLCIFWN